ncbi:MAG: response regulator transcription factor [Actinomycetota bacterium]|nr:response regulator transcription factor [Actinomycetota bacterium]
MPRVLVVEDDDPIALVLVRALERDGHVVVRTSAGGQALDLVADAPFDLVLLDLGLPDLDGVSVCRELRHLDPGLPVLMLTARSEELDVVVGLDAGADDYVTKPFRMAELLARVRARVRLHTEASLSVGDVRVDVSARRAWQGERELDLAAKEFELLAVLVRNAGSVVSRERIMSEVWDTNWFGPTRTLDVHMSSLRRKLAGDPAARQYLTTVRGVGFRFERS